jgi:DNA polymerase III, delta subunit
MIIGHARQREQLEKLDVPVVLLAGPESVGKMTLALELARSRALWPDIMVIQLLTSQDARAVHSWAVMPPADARSRYRYVAASLDGASEQACNQLLRVLEEPPQAARFLLTASRRVLPTIASRAFILRFGLLSTDEVRQVLELRGVAPDVAARDAPLGAGQVAPALAGVPARSLAQVSAVLRALERRDPGQLATALKNWDGEAHELLGAWACEAAVPRWTRFSADTAPGLSVRDARRVLGALSRYPLAAPVLAASAALTPLCR